MGFLALVLAAAVAAGAANSGSTAFTCDLALAGGSQFRLEGHFNASGLRTNLATLIQAEGVFMPAAQGLVITSDGTDSHRWTLEDNSRSQRFDASLTRYGSAAAVLLLERRRFVGRHWGRSLVGTGLCNVARSKAEEKPS
jgi:hypothetical protein